MKTLRLELAGFRGEQELIGSSRAIREIRSLIEQIAVPSMDARLVRPEDSIVLPPLLLMPLDTVMPTILNCGMIAPGILQIDLSLDLDSSRLDRQGKSRLRHDQETS